VKVLDRMTAAGIKEIDFYGTAYGSEEIPPWPEDEGD
jgi:hypothetical protein